MISGAFTLLLPNRRHFDETPGSRPPISPRYGGEEFVVIVDGADAADAASLGERICEAVAVMTEGPRAAGDLGPT